MSLPSNVFQALFASSLARTYVDLQHGYTIHIKSRTAAGERFYLPDSPAPPKTGKGVKRPKKGGRAQRAVQMLAPPATPARLPHVLKCSRIGFNQPPPSIQVYGPPTCPRYHGHLLPWHSVSRLPLPLYHPPTHAPSWCPALRPPPLPGPHSCPRPSLAPRPPTNCVPLSPSRSPRPK